MIRLVYLTALLATCWTVTNCAQESTRSGNSYALPKQDDAAKDRIIEHLAEMWQRQDDELINGKVDLLLFRFAGTQIPIQNFDELKLLAEEMGASG